MPYEIYKVRGGYKVGKDNKEPMKNGRVYASDKPLDLATAKKQLAALYASESTSVIRSFQFTEGYKIGRKDKKKLPNGRTYSTNKFLTKEETRKEIARVKKIYKID